MKEAIILAGGFGTRLKHIVSDVPKPMAPVGGEPFLSVLFERLQCAGIERVILSTGYLHEKIEDFYGDKYGSLSLVYSRETTPLGTGGAIQLGLNHSCTNDVLVLNGDTLFDIDFSAFYSFHRERKATLSVALRNVDDVTRYGSVETDNESRIVSFTEKNQVSGAGLINGGIYLLNKKWFLGLNMPEQFSFEKDVLEKIYQDNRFYGLAFNAYFIDIGVPEDYFRAQTEINPRHVVGGRGTHRTIRGIGGHCKFRVGLFGHSLDFEAQDFKLIHHGGNRVGNHSEIFAAHQHIGGRN